MRPRSRRRSPERGARRRPIVGPGLTWGAGLVVAAIVVAPARPFADPAVPLDAATNAASGPVEAGAGGNTDIRDVQGRHDVDEVITVGPAHRDAATPATAPRVRPTPSARPSPPPAAGTRTPARSAGNAPDASAMAVEVTVRLIVEPHQNARVQWGAKDLGAPPIELKRPRGTGPLDVSVRCPGYLTVHTRLFTDHDDKLVVNLVPVSEESRVLGYRPLEVKPTRKTLP